MQLDTFHGPLKRARTDGGTSYPTTISTLTRPSGDGVIDLGTPESTAAWNGLFIQPFGVGSDDTAPTLRLVGWNILPGNGTTLRDLYVPVPLFDITMTLSTQVGIAGTNLVATERLADAITLTYGNDDVDITITSPGNNLPAHLYVDVKGCTLFSIQGAAGTGTSGNALYKPY